MEYVVHLIILFAIYAILGLSLNLVVGYTGLLSVTQAAFYGLGAYSTAILMTGYHFDFFVSVIAGVAITVIISFIIGLILNRFKGDYYALVSFGFNIIVFSIFLNWQSLTRGPLGIPGIPRPGLFGIDFSSNFNFLILTLLFLVTTYLVCRLVINSSFGRTIKSIREDEEVSRILGYKTIYFKLVIFVISTLMAAVAGSLFASYITFIDPSTFTLNESIFILAIVILGGLASLRGSIVGALFLILLPEILRFVGMPDEIAAQMRQVIFGVILILLMLYKPEGLFGEYKM